MPAPVAVTAPAAAPKPAAPPLANGAAKGAPQAPPKPPPTGAAPPETPVAEAPKIKVKVDGEVVEMTQAELEKYASKGRFSDKATQEAKEAIRRATAVAKQFEERERLVKERAKTDTDAVLRELGIDPDEYAKAKLEKKVAEGRMTQEQRELAAERARAKQLEEQLAQENKKREAEKNQQRANQLQRRIENELVAAAKRANMSLGDESFYAIYESFREAFELGLLPTDGDGLLPHHADRIVEDAMGRLDGAQKGIRENALKLKGPALLEFIGKEAVDNIIAARLEQIRAARGQPARPQGGTPPPAPAQPRPNTYLTPAEAEAQLKKLTRGGG